MSGKPDTKPRKLRGGHIVGGNGDPGQIYVSRVVAADLLGVTPSVLDRAIREGKIIRRKIGQGRQTRELLPYAQVMAFADTFATMTPTEELPT